MANMYKNKSIQVIKDYGHEDNIKDVATNLYESIKNSNIKFSITGLTLFVDFLTQCGVEIEEEMV